MYLLIENPGEAPIESYTLLGMSTTRDCGSDGAIGQFGSGAKHAINVLLRAGLDIDIYCGKTRLKFFTKSEEINDGLTVKTVEKVCCRATGTINKTIDCGWVLDFGAIDWNDVAMALREFVSNAVDRDIRQNGNYKSVSVIPVEKPRAKGGATRVYVEMDHRVQAFFGELPKRFLHFSNDPMDQPILPKTNRNITSDKAVVYRCGVLVRELTSGKKSIFDYNFNAKQLPIDECRNSNDYSTRAACAEALTEARVDRLAEVFESLLSGEDTLEASFDSYYLAKYNSATDELKANWQAAWKRAAGEAVVCLASDEQAVEIARRKGFCVRKIKEESWVKALRHYGVKGVQDVLSADEVCGRVEVPTSAAAIDAVTKIWGWVSSLNMTNGRNKPTVKCYQDITQAEADVMGYYKDSTVYLREDIASGENAYLLKTALEEVTHHVTGAGDNSRDFQNYLIDMVVKCKS